VNGASLDCVAYIGDDLNDLECMQLIKEEGGLIGCPSDAINQIKAIASFQSSKTGGNGAVREFIEELINKQSV
jgi:3-deoxy-D-manno-octulosonate 8-phosphate phosphatase (KDO 8-P phosphatase)